MEIRGKGDVHFSDRWATARLPSEKRKKFRKNGERTDKKTKGATSNLKGK